MIKGDVGVQLVKAGQTTAGRRRREKRARRAGIVNKRAGLPCLIFDYDVLVHCGA